MKPDKEIVIAAILGIVILEAVALCIGINGILLTAVIGILAGLGGWSAPQLKLK